MKRQYIKYLILAALAIYIPLETLQHQDFDIFLLASKDYLQGGNIFAHSYEDGFHFFYSPLFAAVLIPFTYLPVYVSRILWLILNVCAFLRVFSLVKSYLDLDSFTQKQKNLFNFLGVLFSAKLILDNFHNGQMTIFMLLFMLEGWRLIKSGKGIWGAALIALGINFKFLPLVMLPYLFYNKQIKACFYVLGWYVIFLFLPAIVHGWEHNQTLIRSWLGEVNPSNARHVIDTDETTLNGLSTYLPTLLMEKVPDPHALELKRNIANLDAKTVGMIINVVRLVLVAFMLYFLRRRIFAPPPNKTHELWELSYVFCLIPLIFPHQQHYAFFMMFPASLYLICHCFKNYRRPKQVPTGIWVCLALIFLLTNAHLLLGEFNKYYDHYKIITYGGLLLLGLLAVLKPAGEISEK